MQDKGNRRGRGGQFPLRSSALCAPLRLPCVCEQTLVTYMVLFRAAFYIAGPTIHSTNMHFTQ